MPVSMSFAQTANSGLHASPAKRAAMDEQRMKARQAKAGLNPGPGAYDVKRPKVTAAELAGSAAFKSKSDRKNEVSLKEVGDPGAYNPYDNTTLAAATSKSFNKSQQTGAGGFGTKVKRAELSVPNDAPGPGTYDAKLPEAPEAKQGSAFASQTKRGAYLPKQQTPGAGEYDPSRAQEKIGGRDSMFKNKDERFKKSMELEYSARRPRLVLAVRQDRRARLQEGFGQGFVGVRLDDAARGLLPARR